MNNLGHISDAKDIVTLEYLQGYYADGKGANPYINLAYFRENLVTHEVPPLEGGKIPLGYIPDTILGQVVFGGTVNFANNTLTATIREELKRKLGTTASTIVIKNSATGDYGYQQLDAVFFLADNAFTFAGMTFDVGDWLISIGTAWKKIDNTDAVTSVNGKIGAVTLTLTDIMGKDGSGNVNKIADSFIASAATWNAKQDAITEQNKLAWSLLSGVPNIVNTFGGKAGAITLRGGSKIRGDVNFSITSGNELQGVVVLADWAKAENRPAYKYGDSDLTGFGSAATKNTDFFATAAQGVKADAAFPAASFTASNIVSTLGNTAVNLSTALKAEILSDLDAGTQNRIFESATDTASNMPIEKGWCNGLTFAQNHNPKYRMQLAMLNGVLYTRVEGNGIWGGWNTIYGSNNANSTTVNWKAKALTLAGSITGATTGAFSSNVTIGGTLKIGKATLTWNEDKQCIVIDKGFASDSFISAGGINTESGGGGSDYPRLDTWEAWSNWSTSDKASGVLSAKLGVSLNDRVDTLEKRPIVPDGVLTTTNYSSTLDKRYLKLSGGTIKSSSVVPLTIESTTTTSSIHIVSSGHGRYLGVKNNGDLFVTNDGAWISEYIIYHAGNFVADTNYLTPTTAASTYLGKTAKAADSALFDGLSSTSFVKDAGSNISGKIYDVATKKVFSGNALPDAPAQNWVSGIALGSNWNDNHYQHYIVESGNDVYHTREYKDGAMINWRKFFDTGNFDPSTKQDANKIQTTITDSTTNYPSSSAVINYVAANAPTMTGNGATGTWNIGISGNAATATKFNSARTIALTGNVTGSVSSDGANGWSIATTISQGAVTNGMLANSSMTIAGNAVSLGGSIAADTIVGAATSSATFAGNSATATNSSKLGGIAAANYWHNGNAGTTAYNWSAKALTLAGSITGATTGAFSQGVNMATSSGNVGIGITSPAYKLDVNGTLHASDDVTLDKNATISGLTRTATAVVGPISEMLSFHTFEVNGTASVSGLTTLSGGATIPASKTLKIGNVTLSDDGSGNLKVSGTSASNGGIWTESFISAGGKNEERSTRGFVSDTFTVQGGTSHPAVIPNLTNSTNVSVTLYKGNKVVYAEVEVTQTEIRVVTETQQTLKMVVVSID